MAKSNILVKSKLKQAQSLVGQNKLDDAKLLYQQLYEKNKSLHNIGLELAVVYRKLGEFKDVESICKNIINVSPKNAAAHHILGSALQCLGQFDAAIDEYKLAVKLNKRLIEAHYFLGNIYQLTGKFELSADSFYEAIRLNPNFYEALNNLAAILIELNRPIDANKIINRAIKINPHSIQLLCNIAGYCMLDNNIDKASEYINKAYDLDPEFVDALKLKGKIHYRNAEYDDALFFYRKAYAINNNDDITCLIAQILERRGEFDEANKLITPFIETGKPDVATLLTYSAVSRKFKNEWKAIEAIETKIINSELDKTSLTSLHSELGKQYDLLGKYNKAFDNYKKANQVEREQSKQVAALNEIRHKGNTSKEDIDKWFSEYPKELWESLPSSNNESIKPIFVIGMFRSGTTLCEQILSSHPDVHGAGELPDINQFSYAINSSKLHDKSPASMININPDKLIAATNNYLATLNSHSTTAKHVVDKMPSNFMHVGLISKLFPNAHIVHMIRDPRDACLSMYFQRFGLQMKFSTDLVELADYHLAYQRYMQYWHEVLDIQIHNVIYEELMESQEAITSKMLEFCGLEWSDKCMNFHQSKRDINTPSYDQVRKPLYKKSVARWKNYEKHLQPLIDKLGLNE